MLGRLLNWAVVLMACLGLAYASVARAAPGQATYEVLVLNSAVTQVVFGNVAARREVVIQNNGPNAIWCAVGQSALAVLTKSTKISAGATLILTTKSIVYCRAATADQVTGAATTVTEVP